MPEFLDGLVPMVLGLWFWTLYSDEPITMPVVLAVAASVVTYQLSKHFLIRNHQEKINHG